MDFKKLISHIESIDGPIDTPKAQKKAQPIRLDEDTELRVLAGVTPLTESLIAERAKNPHAIGMAAAMKQAGDEPPLKKSTIKKGHEIAKSIENEAIDTKTIDAAQKHSAANPSKKDAESDKAHAKGVKYGYRGPDGSEADEEVTKAKAKAKKESIDTQAFKNKFSKMVEAKKSGKKAEEKIDENQAPTYNVIDGTGKSVGTFRDGTGFMPGPNAKAKGLKAGPTVPNGYKVDYGRDKEKMDEGKKSGKKKPDADNDGVPDWADKKPGEDDNAGKKGMTAKQAKYFGKKNESVKATKKVVAESVEQTLTFREMMKLVVESGGQQQMDPLDATLFDWASRIAKNKLGEGMKAEIYAGLVYERMGGRFEMYDVLAEATQKKKLSESPEDDPFEKTYRSWSPSNPFLAAQDAKARSAKAELLFSPEEKQVVDKLFDEMRSVYPNSARHYKNFRQGRGKKPGKEFSTLSVKGVYKGDRLSQEADAFDQKIRELGGNKIVDPIKKTIVWILPRFKPLEKTK